MPNEPSELELRVAMMSVKVASTRKWLLEVLPAHNRAIEVATARKMMEVACKAVCSACNAAEVLDAQELVAPWDLHGLACEGIRKAAVALYPELAQPVAPEGEHD